MSYYTRERVLSAGRQLGDRMVKAAARLAKDVGFSYEPCPWASAPRDLMGMKVAVNLSQSIRCPYPVWDGASQDTVYGSPEANYAFRFLHDMTHVALGADTDMRGEMRVHLRLAGHLGIPQPEVSSTLDRRIYWVDTAGQSIYHQLTGRFPEDQVHFACVVLQELDVMGSLAEAVRTVVTVNEARP